MKPQKIKLGINGLGRIGRSIFRQILQNNEFEVVAINDINPDINNLAYLLNYDSLYGIISPLIKVEEDYLLIGGEKKVKVFCETDISSIDWNGLGVDVLIESSGVMSNLLSVKQNFKFPNSPKVLFTYANKELESVVVGVNDKNFNREANLFSSSICDTVSLAPIYKALDSEFTILSGHLVTLHPWLSYQNLLDGQSVSWSLPGDTYSHYSLGRSSIGSLIPKKTSAVIAANDLLPNIQEKIHSFSYRVPTSIVSSGSLIVNVKSQVEINQINNCLEMFSEKNSNIFKLTDEPLISIDYKGEEFSAVIDTRWTEVIAGNSIKLVYWYDNEWGYSSHALKVIKLISLQ